MNYIRLQIFKGNAKLGYDTISREMKDGRRRAVHQGVIEDSKATGAG